ncbi:hypothetical protein [Chryseobacterium viscerum]|uniref:HNH endonuclease n=1 Tax=Chryseobacterium viscerum TaxID=1037377 RepID=A0A5N4BX92_9FLAO|nr:hypothetical protein [Chryseobacterium viscerum]KAB1232815.1 hypothetical protein F8D52_03370 [Chryseobacterium viscerum]
MKQEDIDRFVEHNLKNFSVNSTGWNDIIKQMLFEFAIGGWNLEKDVFGKEKFGELRCYTYSENPELNAVIKDITAKYRDLSVKTCEICGSEGKKRGVDSWETTLCLNHYLDRKSIIDIDDDQNIKVGKKVILNIKDIAKAEIDYDLQRLHLFKNKKADHQTQANSFSWQEPNYYLLLRKVPLHLFPEDQEKQISELFQNLQYCEICGHKAVHQKSCLRCHQEHWSDSGYFIEDYGEKSNYIKSCQLDIFTDEDDYEKYFKYDRSFEKSPNHQILFSHLDLREYEKIHF